MPVPPQLARAIAGSRSEAHALAGLGRCDLAAADLTTALANLGQAAEIVKQIGAAEASLVATELVTLSGPRQETSFGRGLASYPRVAGDVTGFAPVRAGETGPAERRNVMVKMVVAGLTSVACGLALASLAGQTSPARVPMTRTAGVVHIVHALGGKFNTNQSNNWSGYNIGADYPGEPTGVRFTAVSGQWTVPTATQHTPGQAENSASWVGIGGGCVTDDCAVTDNTLIQAGTEQDISTAGTASYDAWFEIIPEPETQVSLPVSPGNQIKVSISQTSIPGTWSIVIDNLTTGQTFSTTTPYTSGMDTAEWIEETPLEIGTGGTGLAAMPNLGTVGFTSATLNQATPDFQTIDEMQLVTSSGTVVATPSAPGPAGDSFNDCVWQATCAAP